MAKAKKFVLMGEQYLSEGCYMFFPVVRGSLKRCEKAMSDPDNELMYRSMYIAEDDGQDEE